METYDFESKHIYRSRRESAIDRMLSKPRALRKVAYLDTAEALDTISYLRRGYSPENLWAINRNPAEVAALTLSLKRQGLPTVNTVGLDFEDALTRRVPQVDVIDFDGMSNLTPKLMNMLYFIRERRVVGRSCVFGVTMLAGRESGVHMDAIRYVGQVFGEGRTASNVQSRDTHRARVALALMMLSTSIAGPCKVHVTDLTWDKYQSLSGQPMVWMVCRCEPHRDLSPRESRRVFQRVRGMSLLACEKSLYLKLKTDLIPHWGTPTSAPSGPRR